MSDAYARLASGYQRLRPDYPATAVAGLVEYTLAGEEAAQDGVFVDVGCGTGIFTRLLRLALPRTIEMLGVDPSKEMLTEAGRSTPAAARIRYAIGKAEALPVPDGVAIGIAAATAAHWFDRPAFYHEAARVLRAAGTLAIAENNRTWEQSAFLDGLETILERLAPGYRRTFRRIEYSEEMAGTALFEQPRRMTTEWQRQMDASSFVEMALTSTRTQSAIRAAGREAVECQLKDLADLHKDRSGQVAIPYRTEVYLVRRCRRPAP